eukprot:jgi/Chrzof1/4469/Cz14g14120.t1
MFNEWARLVEFLDLIGQIGLDTTTPTMAFFQCYYRWAALPVMEINFLLAKTEVTENEGIVFQSVYGMPMSGIVVFKEEPDGRTTVGLAFDHPVPTLLVELKISAMAVGPHITDILQENMEQYKSIVEASVPADWPTQRDAVAQRVQQQQQELEAQRHAEVDTTTSATPGQPDTLTSQQTEATASSSTTASTKEDTVASTTSSSQPARRKSTARKTAVKGADAGSPADGTEAVAGDKPARRQRSSSRKTAVSNTETVETGDGSGAATGRKTSRRTPRTTGSVSSSTTDASSNGSAAVQQPPLVNGVESPQVLEHLGWKLNRIEGGVGHLGDQQ